MATTPSHGVQAGLLAYYCLKYGGVLLRSKAPGFLSSIASARKFVAVALITLSMFFGMLPDLIGIYGHAQAALDARAHDNPDWSSARDWRAPQGYYWRAHNSDLYDTFRVVPFYALHIWVDKFFHKEEGGWNERGYVLEVMIDVLMVGLIVFEVRRARRVRARLYA